MHTSTHHLYLQLLSSQLRLVVLECTATARHLYYLILLVMLLINDTRPLNSFIVEWLIVFELLSCVIPCENDEDDTEE
jgi:hypothetical protein